MTVPGQTETKPPTLRLRLYLAGDGPNSSAALRRLREALSELQDGGFDLQLIDVLAHPSRALEDGVLVTPLLVRIEPVPERRLLGNLSDGELLRDVLGLKGGRG